MKKLILILSLPLLVSCINPCGPVGLYIQVVPEFQNSLVDSVDVSFENVRFNSKTTPIPPIIKNERFTYEQELNCYYGIAYVEYNIVNTDVRLLDWSSIQSILDSYVIKISDPNGLYKDYRTSTLRELIENSGYSDRKLVVGYDDNGKVIPNELTFKIPLEKNDYVGNT